MTQRQFIRMLLARVGQSPTRWKAAELLGISESTLSRVISGKFEPSAELLNRFNLKRQVIYVKQSHASQDVNSLTVDTKINTAENCARVQG
jgi:predicted transcriptional regulator